MTAKLGLGLHIYPAPMVNESRLLRVSASLQESGLFREVHLVGTHARGLPAREVLPDGRRIVRIGRRAWVRGSSARKVLAALQWQPLIYRTYRTQDVAAISAHSVWMLPLCWALCLRTGASLIYNAHELETETPSMQGFKKVMAKLIERLLIGQCALVSVVNQSIAEWYVSAYGIQPVTTYNIPLNETSNVPLREELGVSSEELLYIFTGHLTHGRNIPEILRVFSEQEKSHVVFLGDGPYGDLVREAAAKPQTKIHWRPPVAPAHVVSHVMQADVALCLIETDALSYRMSSPNKLFEALTAGTPPLCSDLLEARRFLGDASSDWVLAHPSTELAAAVARIDTADVTTFRESWTWARSWQGEAKSLVDGYARVLGMKP